MILILFECKLLKFIFKAVLLATAKVDELSFLVISKINGSH